MANNNRQIQMQSDNDSAMKNKIEKISKWITICLSIAAFIFSLYSFSESRKFDERELYFEPFSGILLRDENTETQADLVEDAQHSIKKEIQGIKFTTYQGAIAQYTEINMDNNGGTVINDFNGIVINPSNLKKNVYDATLEINEITLKSIVDAGGYKYYDAFLVTTDYVGGRKLYLITVMIDNNSKVVYDKIYTDDILIEDGSNAVMVDDVAVNVYDDETITRFDNEGKKLSASEVYAFRLSYSISRYKKISESSLFKN